MEMLVSYHAQSELTTLLFLVLHAQVLVLIVSLEPVQFYAKVARLVFFLRMVRAIQTVLSQISKILLNLDVIRAIHHVNHVKQIRRTAYPVKLDFICYKALISVFLNAAKDSTCKIILVSFAFLHVNNVLI
jgi:hypothetical protein